MGAVSTRYPAASSIEREAEVRSEPATRPSSLISTFDLAEHDPVVSSPSPISTLSIDCSNEVGKVEGEQDVGDGCDETREEKVDSMIVWEMKHTSSKDKLCSRAFAVLGS